MYKKLFAIALVAIFASLAGAKAQTADEIIKKYSDYMGGTEKHNKITTVYQEIVKKVKFDIGDGTITFKIWTEYPSKYRFEQKLDVDTFHKSKVIICNENGGWVQADTILQEIPEDQVEDVKNMVSQNSIFEKDRLDFSKEFSKVEFAGKERTNGKTTYKLRATTKEDKEFFLYFDIEKYSLIKTKFSTEGPQGEVDIEYFEKNLKDFDGFKVPEDIETLVDGESRDNMHLNKIEFNKPMDAKLFAKPEGNFKEKK